MWTTNDELQDRRLEFHRLLRVLGVTAWVFFVPSAAMPADELSRDNDIDRAKLQQAVRLAQVYKTSRCINQVHNKNDCKEEQLSRNNALCPCFRFVGCSR
jgi:hypothetical protein